MKGIILSGGSGTRLYPITASVSKQLLPVYDKPMIYYPLASLMQLGIKDILIISTKSDIPNIQNLLKDGSHLGISLSYLIQENPNGIAEAFIIGEEFIGDGSVSLILGDNIFHGPDFGSYESLKDITNLTEGASVLAYLVNDPERYGVVEFDQKDRATKIEEKPQNPRSNWAVTGLYFYDNLVSKYAKSLKPSKRGELEITDLNNIYLAKGLLKVQLLKSGFAWLDAGTSDSLLEASIYVHTIEKRQACKIACLEEIAFRRNYISLVELENLVSKQKGNSSYMIYLRKLLLEAKV